MQHFRTRDDRGSIPLALLAVIVVGGIVASLGAIMVTQTSATGKDQRRTQLLQVADAGVQEALFKANNLGDPSACTAAAPCTGSLTGGAFSWTATKVMQGVVHRGYVVESTGTHAGKTRKLRVVLDKVPRFPMAAFGDHGVELKGSNGADSYNSATGLNDTDNGQIGSNNNVVNGQGYTAVAFTVAATTSADVTSMNLTYRTRSGTNTTIPLTLENPRKGAWTFIAGSGPFPDGVVNMTVVASGGTGSATRSSEVTFVAPTIVPVSVVSNTVAPRLCVENNNGAPVRSTTIDVVVQGLTSTDDVVLQFNDGAASKVKAEYVSTTNGNLLFRHTITSASPLRFKSVASLSVSVAATRLSDKTQATRAYTGYPLQQLNGQETCAAS